MKVIKSETDLLAFDKIFKKLMLGSVEVIVWQNSLKTGERQIVYSRLRSFDLTSGKLFFDLRSKEKVEPTQPLYCYVKEEHLIFKSEIQEVSAAAITANLPFEVKFLDDTEDLAEIIKLSSKNSPIKSMAERSEHDQKLLNDKFTYTLDKEDKMFVDKRESPRTRPTDDKWVKVARDDGFVAGFYILFDLSRGGLGFISFSESEFTKGDNVQVVGFNEFDLDDPFQGKVMSVRPVDESGSQYKIGVKFTDGQD